MYYKDGVEIAEKYLEKQSSLYKSKMELGLQATKNNFNKFNEFIINLSEHVEYPFSTALFKGEDKQSTKFHTGVSMVLVVIFYYFDIDLSSPDLLAEVRSIILNSPLGDETYNASSTNMRNVMMYLYKKNNIFEKKYGSLTYKGNLSDEIVQLLNGI